MLENLRNAVVEEHLLNYLKCLSDSLTTGREFTFEAEPSVVANYPDLFAAWDVDHERRYLDQLFQATPRDSLRSLRFSNLTEQLGEGNERMLVGDYTLEVHHTLVAEGIPRRVRGRAEFWLIQEPRTSYWYIWRWRDSATSDEPTWSAIKAAFGR